MLRPHPGKERGTGAPVGGFYLAHGQLEAMLTVSSEENQLILVDGYQRYAALKYLGKDTGLVRVVDEPESQTLYQLLILRGERQWEAIEEAG